MPTDLPILTTEFLRKYNELQNQLQSQQLTKSDESQLKILRDQIKKEQEARVKEQQQFAIKLATRETELLNSQRDVSELKDALKEKVAESDRQAEIHILEIKALNENVKDLKSTIAKLTAELALCQEEPATVSQRPKSKPSQQRLKELREKRNRYWKELSALREYEFSITDQLPADRLKQLIDALDLELAGMMDRYQALSLWKSAASNQT
jgi:hypothetical protein